ncbi:MAG: hypothetical protein HGA85_01205 [Nanoarchaeota archaeon]|nr:hypothetical protein [Nanoarchaeota archaeon]
METPQEVQVWYVLPAIRRRFAMHLLALGLKQKEVASMMGISAPAVNQYLKNKRGEEIVVPEQIDREIAKSARDLIAKKSQIGFETQKILKKMSAAGLICTVCHSHTNITKDCVICFR